MTFLGLTIGELGVLLGIASVVFAASAKLFTTVRQQITTPLIQAIDKLQLEIKQLDRTLTAEHLVLRQETALLTERLNQSEKRWRQPAT